jgi:hypothetical protein
MKSNSHDFDGVLFGLIKAEHKKNQQQSEASEQTNKKNGIIKYSLH